ncbi:unnamed protein product [Ectocarpus sp. 12 AP-2014]
MEVKKESQASGSAVFQQPQAESKVTSAATPATPAAEGAAACNINSESNGNGSAATAAAASEENGRCTMTQGQMPPPSLKRPREVEDWLLHPPDGSDPIDLRKEAEAIYSAFELSLCRDVVFEASLHRELHTGVLTKERLWAEHNNRPPKSVAGGDVYGRIPPREPSTSITCPSCNRAVGAARYAPHLDKCALGSSRGRASRSARSSQPQQEPSKYSDSSSPSSKQSSSRQSSSSKPSPKVSSASKPSAKLLPSPKPKPPKLAPSPKPPKATVSARPSANSRPTSKSPSSSSSSRAPLASRPAPPPPPPAVHPALVDTGREPLHILVKLVDGAPVQTYHRVVLSTPRVEKPQPQQPRSPSTRSLGSDHRPGGPLRDPSHHSASRAVGGSGSSSSTRSASGSSSGNNSSGAGGGVVGAASSTSSARSSFSSLPPRGVGVGVSSSSTAVAGGVSRNIRQKQFSAGGSRPSSPSGGFYDSRLVDSRGGSFSGTGRTSAPVGGGEGGGGRGGGKPNPSKRQTFSSQGNSGQSRRALVGGYAISNNSGGSSAASSPPSPPPMARVPPPLFVSAPRSPSHASPGVGAQGQDMDRRCLERVVEPADRQILSWHD